MTPNQPDRLDRLEAIVESNSRAIQSIASALTDTNQMLAATRASIDGLAQSIAEYSVRNEARLNRLDELIASSQARLSIAESRLDRIENR
jgi:septal ring factor EnvC (AmiA/AmiB activator)